MHFTVSMDGESIADDLVGQGDFDDIAEMLNLIFEKIDRNWMLNGEQAQEIAACLDETSLNWMKSLVEAPEPE